MAENSQLEDMGSDTLSEKISVSDQTKSLQLINPKSDCFVVDMDRLSHPSDKDMTANSRITLQRNFSRKGSQQREKVINSTTCKGKDTYLAASSSPKAALAGSGPLEKSMVVTVGTTEQAMNNPQQVHHQITIMAGGNGGTTTAESRLAAKRFSFRRSAPSSWAIDPRRILFFFATLSSMGTILLIYFTLSMGKPSGNDW